MGSDVRTIALVVIAFILSAAALVLAHSLLVPIVIGTLLSYMLEPAVVLLGRLHVPRFLGATLVFIVTLALVTGTAYGLRHQATAALDRLPGAVQQLRVTVQTRLRSKPRQVTQVERAAAELRQLSGAPKTKEAPGQSGPIPHWFQVPEDLWTSSIPVTQLASDTVIIVVLAYYLLLAGDFFRRRLVEIAGPTFSDKKITLQILEEISAQIERYVFVRALISLIVGVMTGFFLWLIGLPQPALWGVIAGGLNVIPYVGPASVAVSASLAGFLEFKTISMGFATGGIVVGVAVLEAYVLTPWLTSRAGAMNPAAVFVGLLFWGWVWGLPGLLLAVPMLMVIKAMCDHIEVLRPISSLLGD
jgi:predicted PurR-regulated permease PerM